MNHHPAQRSARRARRGTALMMAMLTLTVVGTATLAFTASRQTSVLVTRNIENSMRVRQLATSGLEVAKSILHSDTSGWRTNHTKGVLLQDYALDGGSVSVKLTDIAKRQAGASASASVPDETTTEVEIAVTASVDGSTWTSLANMSIPQVTKGQYAIYGQRLIHTRGTNQIGRWLRSPKSCEKRRINLGTMANRVNQGTSDSARQGVLLEGDLTLEHEVWPIDPEDERTSRSTWIYCPYTGGSESARPAVRTSPELAQQITTLSMSFDESIRMKPAPSPAATVPSLPALTNSGSSNGNSNGSNASTITIAGENRTLYPFRVGSTKGKANNRFKTTGSTLTFTAGTYEIYGTWEAVDTTIRIQGSVKFVVAPRGNTSSLAIGESPSVNDPSFDGIVWTRTTVEMLEGADLEIDNGYRLTMDHCWIGGYYQCVSEMDSTRAAGDPHKKVWMGNTFQPTPCDSVAPEEPHYFEPWHIRIYPIGSQMSPFCAWQVTDTSMVGSLFLPMSTIYFNGNSQLYGRVAADSVILQGTSRVRYDHALDDLSGLTEGRAPNRGGDPDTLFPIRLLRWGPDRGNAP